MPEVFTKNRIVLPQSHPECRACDKLMHAIDQHAVSSGRTRLRLLTLEAMVREEAPDVYSRYRARVARGDTNVVGAPGPGADVTLPGAGPEGGQHAI